jgi:hypothetical protein
LIGSVRSGVNKPHRKNEQVHIELAFQQWRNGLEPWIFQIMKHYKLSAWPDLPAAYRRTAYRRVLHEMSQRFMTLSQLVRTSGLPQLNVSTFLSVLSQHGVLIERGQDEPDSFFGALQTLVRRRPLTQHR